VLDARLRNLARKTLRNFGRFGHAAPFGNQTGHIRTSGEESTFFPRLDMHPDRRFVHGILLIRGVRVA